MSDRLRVTIWHALFGTIFGMGIGIVLFAILFLVLLNLPIPYIGNPLRFAVLTLGPCIVAGLLLGAVHGFREWPFMFPSRMARRAVLPLRLIP